MSSRSCESNSCVARQLRNKGFQLPGGEEFCCPVSLVNPPTDQREAWKYIPKLLSSDLINFYRENGLSYSAAYEKAAFIRNIVSYMAGLVYTTETSLGKFFEQINQSSSFLLCNICHMLTKEGGIFAAWNDPNGNPYAAYPGHNHMNRGNRIPVNSSNKLT